MSKIEDMVYINCFYYGFYVKKEELYKYNIKQDYLYTETKKIINNNKINKKIDNNYYSIFTFTNILEQLYKYDYNIL